MDYDVKLRFATGNPLFDIRCALRFWQSIGWDLYFNSSFDHFLMDYDNISWQECIEGLDIE